MPAYRIAVIAVFSFVVAACASLSDLSCDGDGRFAIQESLYFGTGKPDGAVTPEEWTRFVETTVTPRFAQGFTVSQASGQWRNADGSIIRESTQVLHLVHPDDALIEKFVAEIISSYKARFRQEAVLRVRSRVCISF